MTLYLDNAATSFPKPEEVYQATDRTLRRYGVNPGRGSYGLVLEAGRLVYRTREAVAEMFNIADEQRVVFTANATEAINLALFGLLQPGDRVVTSSMEHNAVSRPLYALRARGIQVTEVPADRFGRLQPDDVKAAAMAGGQAARMVVLCHCSNVTGTVQPIEEIGPWCRRHGILFMVDAAQSAGLLPIDVQSMAIDVLAAPGHKCLLGPPGTGFLYLREDLQPTPLIFGGTGGDSMSEEMPEALPERLESGTLNAPALAGLLAGIEYVQRIGIRQVREHKTRLLEALLYGLRQLPGIRIYGPGTATEHGGVVSFTMAGRDPAETGFLLDEQYGICVRTGLHCAPSAHGTIGTLPSGTIRVSPGLFNTREDVDRLLSALTDMLGPNFSISHQGDVQ